MLVRNTLPSRICFELTNNKLHIFHDGSFGFPDRAGILL